MHTLLGYEVYFSEGEDTIAPDCNLPFLLVQIGSAPPYSVDKSKRIYFDNAGDIVTALCATLSEHPTLGVDLTVLYDFTFFGTF